MTDKKPPPERRQRKHQAALRTGKRRDVDIATCTDQPDAISDTLIPPSKPKPEPKDGDDKPD